MRATGARASPVPAFSITHKVGFPSTLAADPSPLLLLYFLATRDRFCPLTGCGIKIQLKTHKNGDFNAKKIYGDGTPSRGGLWPLDLPNPF